MLYRLGSPAIRHNSEAGVTNAGYWRQHADRARQRAEELRQRTKSAPHSLSKKRILNLAKRYDQMANLAEERHQTYLREGP
jgi:hypothetical protein